MLSMILDWILFCCNWHYWDKRINVNLVWAFYCSNVTFLIMIIWLLIVLYKRMISSIWWLNASCWQFTLKRFRKKPSLDWTWNSSVGLWLFKTSKHYCIISENKNDKVEILLRCQKYLGLGYGPEFYRPKMSICKCIQKWSLYWRGKLILTKFTRGDSINHNAKSFFFPHKWPRILF